MADEPTPLHPDLPEEPAEEAEANRHALTREQILGMQFLRASVAGTELEIREPSVDQIDQIDDEALDDSIDDRELQPNLRPIASTGDHRPFDPPRPARMEEIQGSPRRLCSSSRRVDHDIPMSGHSSKSKKRSTRRDRHGFGRCTVCGAPVQFASRLHLGDNWTVPIYLCSHHQKTFGIDYPPEPPLK